VKSYTLGKFSKNRKKIRISSKGPKTQELLIQAAKRVIASGKPFTKREKRRIERLFILA